MNDSDCYAAATDAVTKQQLLSAGHAFLSSFDANGTVGIVGNALELGPPTGLS